VLSRLTDGVYGEEIVTEHAPALTTRRSRPTGEGVTERATVHATGAIFRSSVPRALQASVALVVAGILAQIAYPLLAGDALRVTTMLSVLLLSAACALHAGATWGARGALGVLVVAGGLGFAAETVGVHTGFPFGDYAYSNSLGVRLAGVPIIVPLAWTMMAYPCLLLGRRLGRMAGVGWIIPLTGGIGLAGWDLFLDPQMVAQGHWSWANPHPALPGVPGVPLTNYAGWLLVSVLMITAMDRALPTGSPTAELVPAVVLAWTWLGSALGNLVFFDRPWVALYGGLVMGAVTVPYLLDVLRHNWPGRDRLGPGQHELDGLKLDGFRRCG
jgi:uncharacterized membrane protein